jgi:2-polyprenyl-6-methoxyphenol hydroxylase-like FAD-dependent oxidoreductase
MSEGDSGHGRQALVIGGSMAGLLGARVLADHFDRVTVLDRDALPGGPEYRAGVPQSRHVHVLLAKGLELLEQFFPGFGDEALAAGAVPVLWPADVLWLSPVGWSRRFSQSITLLYASRELFEWIVRRRVAALPNVRLVDRHEVMGLVAAPDRSSVAGVQVRQRGSRDGGDSYAGETSAIPADLVLDASGRGSPAPRWLEELGYEAPSETVINAQLGYASRYYARRADHRADWQGMVVGTRSDTPRGGAVFPIEGGRWLVTLVGYGADYPPIDEAGFLAYAKSLRTTALYDVICAAEPLSPVRGYRRTENRRRHYERLGRWPERFLVTGDATCSFNPVYGQGMTAAALAASVLQRCLGDRRRGRPSEGGTGLARQFQRQLARRQDIVWLLATGEDLRYPTTIGATPNLATRWFHRYVDRLTEVATERAGPRPCAGVGRPHCRPHRGGQPTRRLNQPESTPSRQPNSFSGQG